jgi:hypothetical protein
LSFRVAGEAFTFPGSRQGSDGVFFPNEVLPQLAHTLSQGVYHERAWQEELATREAQWSARLQDAEHRAAMGDATLAAMDRLRQAGPEAMAKWLDDLERQWPLLMANAEKQVLEQELVTARTAQAEIREEQEARQLYPKLEDILWGQVEAICAVPEAKGLDAQKFYSRLVTDFLDQIFYEADRDDPSQGIKQGELLVNYDVITRQAEYEVGLLRAAAAAAKKNAGVLATPAGKPTVTASGHASAEGERKAVPKFKTQQDYFDWLDSPEGKAHFGLAGTQ